VKHAGTPTLTQIEPLLARLRRIDGLVERKPGTFYLRSKAFLHFHEDPAGVFADVKLDGQEFQRIALAETDAARFAKMVAEAVTRMSPQRQTARRAPGARADGAGRAD